MLTNAFYVTLTVSLEHAAGSEPFFVAVGAGDEAWDDAVPGEDRTSTQLFDEVVRRAVPAEQVTSLDERGQPTEAPTTRLQFTVTFGADEAVGTLRECGLFGGEATEERGSGTLLSYFTHARIDKAEGMTLVRTIRVDLTPQPIVPGTRATRYLGNTATTELHDLDNEEPNCQIDEVRFDRRYYFVDIETARAAGYDFCAYCFGREQSVR